MWRIRKRIVIDPGHGGGDPGAVAEGLREADVVLRIAHVLKAICDSHPDFEAHLTRDRDVRMGLWVRAREANEHDAILVSIHCNAAANTEAAGAEVWCFSERDQRGRETKGFRIARAIQARLAALGLKDRGAKPIYDWQRRKYVYRRLFVLRHTERAAVLVECCFLSNPGDRARIEDPRSDFHETVAAAIFEGVRMAI